MIDWPTNRKPCPTISKRARTPENGREQLVCRQHAVRQPNPAQRGQLQLATRAFVLTIDSSRQTESSFPFPPTPVRGQTRQVGRTDSESPKHSYTHPTPQPDQRTTVALSTGGGDTAASAAIHQKGAYSKGAIQAETGQFTGACCPANVSEGEPRGIAPGATTDRRTDRSWPSEASLQVFDRTETE